MISAYNLSWMKDSFLAKLVLLITSAVSTLYRDADDYLDYKIFGYSYDLDAARARWSAMSSTCFSIVSSAYARIKIAKNRTRYISKILDGLWCLPTWILPSAICYWGMVVYSNKVVKGMNLTKLTPEMLDVRQSILRCRARLEVWYFAYFVSEAKMCIEAALAKNPKKAHTRGLLMVGLADIYTKMKLPNSVEFWVMSAGIEARKSIKEEPLQASRIFKNLSEIADWLSKQPEPINDWGWSWGQYSCRFQEKAEELAERVKSKDQLMKIEALK